MDGSDDVRPKSGHRSSDPSLEEMLRRARDARLGSDRDTSPRDRLFKALSRRPAAAGASPWSSGWARFLVGVIVGMLLCYGVVQVSVTPSDVSTRAQPTSHSVMATLPTATETSIPTAAPTAQPPTPAAIVALVQAYYDTQGPYAGTYVLRDVTALQIDSQDADQLTVCIAYEAATTASSDSVVGTNTRLFTLAAANDGTWHVVQMGTSGSCSLT